MVTDDGYAKIVDFGLAKLTEVKEARVEEGRPSDLNEAETVIMGGAKAARLTAPGLVLGTFGYMSPEQAQAKAVDQRSDIFSFGAVLYELFTGKEPFRGNSAIEVLHAILYEDPQPLTEDLPEGLRHLMAKALEKDPDHRYQTMRELITDLKRLKRDTESSHRTGAPKVSARKTALWPLPASRSGWLRWGIMLLLIGALVIAGVLVTRIDLSGRKQRGGEVLPQIRTLAILPFRNIRPESESDFLGFSLADAITTKLAYVQSLVVRPSGSVERFQGRVVEPKQAGEELGADAILMGSFLKEGSRLQINTQLVDIRSDRILWSATLTVTSQDLITLQDKISEEIVKNLRLRLSTAEYERMRRDVPRNPLAYEYYLRALSLGESSLDRVKLAIDLLEKSVELDPDYAPAWMELGIKYNAFGIAGFGGNYYYEKSDRALMRALHINSDLPRAHLQLAQNFAERGRTQEAVNQLRKLLAINPNSPELHLGLSYVLRYAGMLEESLQEAARIEHIDPKYWRNQPRAVVNAYLYAGRYQKFLESIPPVETAYTLFYRGFAYYHMNEIARAMENFDRAYQIDPNDVFSRMGMALRFSLQGEPQKGLEMTRQIEAEREREGVPDGGLTYKLAELYSILGKRHSAVRMLEKAIEEGFFAYSYMIRDPLLEKIRGSADYERVMEIARRRHEDFKKWFFSHD